MNFAGIRKKAGTVDGDRVRDITLMIQIALIIAEVTSVLFYFQAIVYKGLYPNDLSTHIQLALYYENYSILFMLMKWLVLTFNDLYSVAFLEGLTIGLSFICAAVMIEKLFSFKKSVSMGISFCLLVLTSLYIPGLFPRYYKGSVITQPWHNITYSAMRPFAILSMLSFALLYKSYREEKKIAWNYWIATALLLAFATAVKPVFLMGFAPGLLVVLLIDFFGRRNTFKNEFFLGCCVLPAVAVLPLQAAVLFDESNGFIIAPSVFYFRDGLQFFIMRFVTALPLPIMVYIHNRRRLPSAADVTAWGYAAAVLEGMFMMEDGSRMEDGNFTWAHMIMGYFLFLYTYGMLVRDYKEFRDGTQEKTTGMKIYLIVGFAFMALHTITGLKYLVWLYQGNTFYL